MKNSWTQFDTLQWCAVVLCIVAFVLLCQFCEAEDQTSPPCLVVVHASTLGKRLVWTALTGVPVAPGANFDYVDSNLPAIKMKYNGKDLQRLHKAGVHIVVLEKNQHETCATLQSTDKGGTK